MTTGAPNVWTQMNYIPPRGQCNHKASIIAARCPCLRFMLHPLKSSSSYECDGCTHHASFHSMENKAEDEIRKRWEQEAKDKADKEHDLQLRPKKRVRAIEFGSSGGLLGADGLDGAAAGGGRASARTRGVATRKTGRGSGARSKTRIIEVLDDDACVELD